MFRRSANSCVSGIQTLFGIASVLFGLLFLSPCACAQTPAAHESFSLFAFDIPAGPLDQVLTGFATQTGVSLSFNAGDVQGKHSHGVHGTLSVSEGLQTLLEGTGLTSVAQTASGYALAAGPAASSTVPQLAATGDTTLPTVKVAAHAVAPDREFAAESTSGATHTDTPLFNLPQSVAVVTPAVLESQQAQSAGDGLGNVSGVLLFSADSSDPTALRTPFVRGSPATVLINGMNATTANAAMSLPIAALAGVEVIKGAASTIAGSVVPGGMINVTTKQPQADPVHELTVQAGSYGDWLTSLDLAGALSSDRKLTYRFIVSGQHASENFIGQDGKRDLYIAPSVGYESGGTKLVVGLDHHTYSQPVAPQAVLLPAGPLVIDGPVDPQGRSYSNGTSAFYDLSQRFGDAVTFRSRASYNTLEDDFPPAYSFLKIESFSPLTASYAPFSDHLQSHNLNLENNVRVRLQLGSVQQTLLAGSAYQRISYSGSILGIGPELTAPLPWRSPPSAPESVPTLDLQDSTTFANTFYLQDQLVWHSLHVLASISHSQQWAIDQPVQGAWSPSFGILYQLTDQLAVYANVQRSFIVQSLLLAGGGTSPPSRGRSVEAGFKFSLFDDQLSGTVAVFRTSTNNVAIYDPNTGLFQLESTSFFSNRGIEFDMTGQLIPGWKMIASYTYNAPTPPVYGGPVLPKHVFNLWTTYDLQGERWHGWGVGAGIRARSGYAVSGGFVGETYPVPGQARTDASIYYRGHGWSTTLGVKNIFNRRLYADYAEQTFVEIEPTRLYYLTAVYDF
jgi:iron complex outermembrane receptor protein